MSVLVCDNLSKKHNNSEVRNFSYNFLDNQIYAILEKNEEYQNSLLNLICGKEKPDSGCAREGGVRSLRNRWNSSAWVEYIIRCSSTEESPCRARSWRIWILRQNISFQKVIDNPSLPSDLVSCKFKPVAFLLICSTIGNGSLELMEKRKKKK